MDCWHKNEDYLNSKNKINIDYLNIALFLMLKKNN